MVLNNILVGCPWFVRSNWLIFSKAVILHYYCPHHCLIRPQHALEYNKKKWRPSCVLSLRVSQWTWCQKWDSSPRLCSETRSWVWDPSCVFSLSVCHQMHLNRTGLFVVTCGIFSYLCGRNFRMCSFRGLKFNAWALPSYRTPQCSPQLLNCRRWEAAA